MLLPLPPVDHSPVFIDIPLHKSQPRGYPFRSSRDMCLCHSDQFQKREQVYRVWCLDFSNYSLVYHDRAVRLTHAQLIIGVLSDTLATTGLNGKFKRV